VGAPALNVFRDVRFVAIQIVETADEDRGSALAFAHGNGSR
jgi:hypothetical protein